MSDLAPAEETSVDWIDQREACRLLGTSVGMFQYWTRQGQITTGRWARKPDGGKGRSRLYARAEIERLAGMIRERREQRANAVLPEGTVDRNAAAKLCGISPFTWKSWVTQGKVPGGREIRFFGGERRSVYTLDEIERIRAQLQTPDPSRPYRDPESPGAYVLPAGMVRRDEAWGLFGVSMPVWERSERQGKLTCGEMVYVAGGGRLKLYPIAELKRLLAAMGRFSPPYADPDRPGCVRVPLGGRGMKRCEALIDANALPLIEGGHCHLGRGGANKFVNAWLPDGRHRALRRLVLGLEDPEQQVGHRNEDPLDCRRENLIVRTIAERSFTARKMSANSRGEPCSSRFKGVYWDATNEKWRARITREGKARWLGRHHDEIAAAVAYDEAARDLFGEHGRLNFPDGVDARLEQEAAEAAATARLAA